MLSITRTITALCTLTLGAAPAFSQCDTTKLVPTDSAASADFGEGVAIDGDVALGGAPDDDGAANNAGAAYVFRRTGTTWAQEQKLLASDAASNDHFGQVVSIDGVLAVVGAPDDDDAGSRSGSAYVYRFDGTSWNQEQKLVAPDAAASDRFGWSVGISGDTIAIGAKFDDDTIGDSGSAYVFRVSGTTWSMEQKLNATVPASIAQFGDAIAIDGDTVVVGAWQDDSLGFFTGAAFVFRRVGTVWSQEQKLIASDAADFRWFGRSVGVVGDLIAVGAYGDDAGGSDAGAAYVFRFGGATWTEEQKLTASDATSNDRMGWSIGVHPEVIVVGADSADNGAALGAGAVYVYRNIAGVWHEEIKPELPDQASGDDAGWACAIDSTAQIIVGARGAGEVGGASSGRAVVFPAACELGATFCDASDGALASCPCAQGDPDTGCQIPQGTGGVKMAVVTQQTSPINRVTATGTGFPAMSTPTSIVIRSASLDTGSPVIFGDGLRCVGVPLVRLAATFASAGTSIHTFGHGAMAGVGPFYYQLWFRSTPISFCDPIAAFNLSSGRSLVW
jgi:hypothetical protein